MAKIEFRKARYINAQKSRIDMEIKHQTEGWIPITIDAQEYPLLWPEVVATNPLFDHEFAVQEAADNLAIQRQAKQMPRSAFCIVLRNLGVIDQQWAVSAAQGNMPSTLHGALVSGGLDISMDDATIVWASLVLIGRNHEFVEAIRKHLNLTPIQMDELFA